MSAGFFVLAPGGATTANFFEFLFCFGNLSPENSTASFLEKGRAEVEQYHYHCNSVLCQVSP